MTYKKVELTRFPTLKNSKFSKTPRFYKEDGKTQDGRLRYYANSVSDKGRCWWIYRFIMNNPLHGKKRW